MIGKPSNDRAAYSPTEFAALFGKSPTWGYRQLYSGKVKAIQGQGRLAIPASEVERLTGTAVVYDGKPTVKKKSAVPKLPKASLRKSWPEILQHRRDNPKLSTKGKSQLADTSEARDAAFKRMTKRARKNDPPNQI